MAEPDREGRTKRRLWGEITYEDWCALLDQALAKAEKESIPFGTVWIINGGSDISIKGFIYRLAEQAGYEEPSDEIDFDEAREVISEHFMEDDRRAVFSEVTTSMVSGSCGLGQFICHDRGYFYRFPDFGIGDDEGEQLPLLSAWEPASDHQVYKAAFLKTYDRFWSKVGLPPLIGEWAAGPPRLMTTAISKILMREPRMWEGVIDNLKGQRGTTPSHAILECIAHQTAVARDHIKEAKGLLAKDRAGVLEGLTGSQVSNSTRQGLVALFWYSLLTPSRRSLWETYPDTVLELGSDRKVSIDLRQIVNPDTRQRLKNIEIETPFAVLTACNPFERHASEEENGRRTGELGEELRAIGVLVTSADGISSDAKHREAGYAVSIPLARAKALAERYGQAAFFWFDGEKFWIMPALVQAEPIQLPLHNSESRL